MGSCGVGGALEQLKFSQLHPQITFDVNERDFDQHDRLNFWESMRPWLLERGYELYRPNYTWNGDVCDEVINFEPIHEFEGTVQHPYSPVGGSLKPSSDLTCFDLRVS